MRVYDQGSSVRVVVSRREVELFNEGWPGSALEGRHTFVFDKRTGDLEDHHGKGDGPEAVALSEEAWKVAEGRGVVRQHPAWPFSARSSIDGDDAASSSRGRGES